MKYLVTGGAGFIGSYVTQALLERGDSVWVLDTGPDDKLQHLLENKRLHVRQAGAENEELVDGLVSKVDQVIHLAANCGVRQISQYPLDSMLNNLGATENILKACAEHEKQVFIASSSEVFGSSPEILSEESPRLLGAPWKMRWTYGYAKALEEAMAFAYGVQEGLPVIVGRFFNVTGPRHEPHRAVIPRFVADALSGESITVYGTGDQYRCFMHINDCVNAILAVMDGPFPGEAFNIGRAEKRTMNELAELVKKVTQSDSEIVHVGYAKAFDPEFEDVQSRACDNSKLTLMTGWSSQYDTEDIIRETVEYQLNNAKVAS